MKELIQYDDDGGMAVSSGLEPFVFQPGEIVSWRYGSTASFGYVISQLSISVVWVGFLDGSGAGSKPASGLRRTPFMAVAKERP